MKSAFILSVIVVIAVSACTREKSIIPLMTCKISSLTNECTSTPTLQSGKLRILPGMSFTFEGQYNACFHQETVSIHGKYKGSGYSNGLTIELLASKIKGLKSSDFPSTIAVVTLEKSTLKGAITDIWATIRSPVLNDGKHVVEITCKAD